MRAYAGTQDVDAPSGEAGCCVTMSGWLGESRACVGMFHGGHVFAASLLSKQALVRLTALCPDALSDAISYGLS